MPLGTAQARAFRADRIVHFLPNLSNKLWNLKFYLFRGYRKKTNFIRNKKYVISLASEVLPSDGEKVYLLFGPFVAQEPTVGDDPQRVRKGHLPDKAGRVGPVPQRERKVQVQQDVLEVDEGSEGPGGRSPLGKPQTQGRVPAACPERNTEVRPRPASDCASKPAATR